MSSEDCDIYLTRLNEYATAVQEYHERVERAKIVHQHDMENVSKRMAEIHSKNHIYQILVTCPDRTYAIDISPEMTAFDLKTILYAKTNIPISYQKLSRGGRVIRDPDVVSATVRSGDTVQMSTRPCNIDYRPFRSHKN